MALLRLTPALKRYAWGDARALPEILGLPADGSPLAEAWYGAHPQGPATAEGEPLDARIAAAPEALLGTEVAARFGGLPYLLKLLAAARPLSIQVHPDPAQAAEGFAREDAAGVPRDAAHRCYRDPHAKPELIVALTPFDALVGFRPLAEVHASLDGALRELGALLPRAPLRALVTAYFGLAEEAREEALGAALERARGAAAKGDADARWLVAAQDALGPDAAPDPGLAFVVWLRRLRLAPGEAMYLPAGVLHAYLAGAGIEIMASSDNVLRAGLTPKHVDRGELLRIVRFEAPSPEVLRAPEAGPYPTGAPEFALEPVPSSGERVAEGPETLLLLGGPDARAEVRGGEGETALARGEALLVPAGERYGWATSGASALWRARVAADHY